MVERDDEDGELSDTWQNKDRQDRSHHIATSEGGGDDAGEVVEWAAEAQQ